MVVIEIEDKMGNTIGGFRLFENDKNGEINIVNVVGDICVADIDFDILFESNDKRIRVQLER